MNKKMKKAIATICIGTVAISVTPVSALAETITVSGNQEITSEISPRWVYISDIARGLSISGTTAYVTASTEGFAGQATKAKIIAELQVKSSETNWIPVKIWTETNNDFYVQVNDTHTVVSGNTYRLKVTATVWNGSDSETQTVYSLEIIAPSN